MNANDSEGFSHDPACLSGMFRQGRKPFTPLLTSELFSTNNHKEHKI
jgi:hypothetical protein